MKRKFIAACMLVIAVNALAYSLDEMKEDELQFKLLKSSINGPDMEQYRAQKAEETRNEEILSQNFISIFVSGFAASQADIQEIIESEILSKLSTLNDYTAKIVVASKGVSNDSIIAIAKEGLSKYALIINARPFQNQYYLQSKLISVANGEYLISTRASSSLASLDDVLNAVDQLTNQVIEQLKDIRANEIAEEERKIEAENAVQEILLQQEQEEHKHKEKQGNIFNIFSDNAEETYFLTIENTKKFSCRVIVAGQQIGMVNPYTSQRFVVPTYLFGRIQIVQVGGKGRSAESVYYVPKQDRNAMISLNNED